MTPMTIDITLPTAPSAQPDPLIPHPLELELSDGGQSVWVIVATSRFGNKYLKTRADGEQPDNLLSLPECAA